ncbi:hypothetical protein CGL52_02235 [Pyrobaculum aerophilum]|uniref:Uncharacterized protein n=1 Tax=Pyrobaculum aerophilum TaxID=13773 RepID=A0A371R6A6_9CREN|nr:hypothetical protein CGL52_02235 [Pyrobaculum aerophilum]
MRGVNKTKRQNKTKGNSQASAPQGGAERLRPLAQLSTRRQLPAPRSLKQFKIRRLRRRNKKPRPLLRS